jgi:hypothetical protein
MNLWAKNLGQLAVFAVALFFFSCEDKESILGFKNPNKKFDVVYAEIPVESSVLLLDSVRTSNIFPTGETKRILVGNFFDEKFGEVKATGFSQYLTSSAAKLESTSIYDSVSLLLSFDYYTTGSPSPTTQTISIHELQNAINYDSGQYYFNRSLTPFNPATLGTKSFSINPADFKKQYDEGETDSLASISIPLEQAFGERIFNSAMQYSLAATTADSLFIRPLDFFKAFYGIAINPSQMDKVVGINPAASVIRLHYHDDDTDSLRLDLSLSTLSNVSSVVSYSHIENDRSTTELAGLTQFNSEFYPPSDLRYVMSGAGILTKLDFQNFYDFVDSDSNQNILINSAELIITGTETSNEYAPINSLSLKVLNNNYFKRLKTQSDSTSVSLYRGYLGVFGNTLAPVNPNVSDLTPMLVQRSLTNTSYNAFITLFSQQLYLKDPSKERFRFFALYPEIPSIGKSVNRIAFNKDNIKLRVYYTRPTQPTP